MDTPKMSYVAPRYVDVGMEVVVPYVQFCPPEEREAVRAKGTGVRCKVIVAAGYHARILNEKRGIDVWRHIRDLFVPAKKVG